MCTDRLGCIVCFELNAWTHDREIAIVGFQSKLVRPATKIHISVKCPYSCLLSKRSHFFNLGVYYTRCVLYTSSSLFHPSPFQWFHHHIISPYHHHIIIYAHSSPLIAPFFPILGPFPRGWCRSRGHCGWTRGPGNLSVSFSFNKGIPGKSAIDLAVNWGSKTHGNYGKIIVGICFGGFWRTGSWNMNSSRIGSTPQDTASTVWKRMKMGQVEPRRNDLLTTWLRKGLPSVAEEVLGEEVHGPNGRDWKWCTRNPYV